MKLEKKSVYIIFGIIINMCLGAIYSWSIFRKPLEDIMQIDTVKSGLPYMFFLIFYALAMPLTGSLIGKYGPRIITLTGGITVSLGWFLSGYAGSINTLIITYGVIGGLGVGIVYGAPLAVSSKWFPEKKGLAVGLTLAGFGLSPFVTAPIARKLIAQWGVFSSFKILGAAFFVIIIILALPLKFPDRKKDINSGSSSEDKNSKELSLKEVLKDRRFYILWSCFVIGTFTGLMAIGISSPAGQEIIGLTPDMGAAAVALFAIFNGVGRPIFGTLADKLKFRKTSLLSFFIIILASVLMLSSGEGTVYLYVISFSLFWLILGGWLAIAPTSVSNIFGSENYARNYGVLFTAYGAGALLANLISGIIRDRFGSYLPVFYTTISAAVLGIFIVLLFFKRRKEKSDNR